MIMNTEIKEWPRISLFHRAFLIITFYCTNSCTCFTLTQQRRTHHRNTNICCHIPTL